MDIWVPISTPAIPHPGGYYAFLARITYTTLIKPAISTAMDRARDLTSLFELSTDPTALCRRLPADTN